MSWTIISVRAPAYVVEDSHNRPFHTSEELPWIDNGTAITAIDSEDGTPAPGRPPPDVTLCITTRHFPRNPGVGFVFGRDRETCDVLLPPENKKISKQQFAITFRTDISAVILRNLSKHLTYIEDELGPRRLQTEISFGQQTIKVRLPKLDIELTRPWRDDEITSPHYTSFLAKLAQMLPNLGGMRLASSTASTMQSSTSRSQDGYRLGAVIGHGKSSIVYHGSHRETGDIVAIKHYDQGSSGSAEACKELSILCTLNHKHIVTIHAFNFCIRQQAQLIMEYAPLGSMAYQSSTSRFLYHEARTILHQVLQALGYLHSKGITHRDVKPDNILIMTREPMHAKLADFALSSKAERPTTVCGTERYTAPEVYRPPYTAKVDIWSVGVIVMELWIGLPSQLKTAKNGKWAEMLRTNRPEKENPEIKELLDACLQLQPTKRWSAEQCLKLAFFRSRTGTLPDAAGATHEIDATRSASPTRVVDGLPETAPCHAIEDDLPDTAPRYTVEDGLPDAAPCHTEASQVRYSHPRQAEMRECGNEDQELHLSQPEWMHQQAPKGWSSRYPPLSTWASVDLDGQAVDDQNDGTSGNGAVAGNENSLPQPVPAPDDCIVYKGTTYHFFRWQGRRIAYTNAMVNLTQLLAAAERGTPGNRKIRDIFRHTKRIVAGDGIRGTFVPYHNVVQVCRCLQIKMAGLPDFLVSLDGGRQQRRRPP
ncbi:hypothetical protein MY11210_009530 [Beauveria gryllotalpidicola]